MAVVDEKLGGVRGVRGTGGRPFRRNRDKTGSALVC